MLGRAGGGLVVVIVRNFCWFRQSVMKTNQYKKCAVVMLLCLTNQKNGILKITPRESASRRPPPLPRPPRLWQRHAGLSYQHALFSSEHESYERW